MKQRQPGSAVHGRLLRSNSAEEQASDSLPCQNRFRKVRRLADTCVKIRESVNE